MTKKLDPQFEITPIVTVASFPAGQFSALFAMPATGGLWLVNPPAVDSLPLEWEAGEIIEIEHNGTGITYAGPPRPAPLSRADAAAARRTGSALARMARRRARRERRA